MKKIVLNLFLFSLAVSFVACSGKKEETVTEQTEETAAADEWPEMDEFHFIMAESFHPFKDSTNLDPAKANAAEMAKVAEKWLGAPLPEKVNTDAVKADLQQLKTDCDAFAQLVTTGDATQIGEALTKLHDQFHKLQEAWYSSGDGHAHDGHNH